MHLVLNLTILVFYGKHTERKHLRIHELFPSSNVRFLKRRVEELLGRRADEIQVLVGDRIFLDSEVLSECGFCPESPPLVLVSYPELSREWCWEKPDPEGAPDGLLLQVCNTVADFPLITDGPTSSECSDGSGNDVLLQSRWLQEESKPRRPRPPLLMRSRPCQRKQSEECLCTEAERRLLESGGLFRISVHCRIFLGLRCHQRRCTLPASARTSVGELEDRLTEWLGSAPDELVLTLGTVSLERQETLGAYNVQSAVALGALAEYKDAV